MKSLTISEIRNQVITGSYSISHEGMKEDGHGWEKNYPHIPNKKNEFKVLLWRI